MRSLKDEWDVYQQKCPSRTVISRIADKWVILALGMLESGPKRFNQIRREIEGISQKSLTETLRTLERDGLVRRKVITSSPIAVEYSITPIGRTLARAVDSVRSWTESNMEEVLASQRRFDGR
jgi:DNA-binding HxlR family transcriptional regulator